MDDMSLSFAAEVLWRLPPLALATTPATAATAAAPTPDPATDTQTAAASTPMNVFWRCEPPLSH